MKKPRILYECAAFLLREGRGRETGQLTQSEVKELSSFGAFQKLS